MGLPDTVQLTEVGMRDGFQMEAASIPTATKIAVGEALIAAGFRRLEVTSFVSPKAVPQLADAAEVVAGLRGRGATLAALVPNAAGAARAAAAGVDEMIVFVSASETHNGKNVRRTVADSLAGVAEITGIAAAAGIRVHGAVATAFGCPFEGDVAESAVLAIVEHYAGLGIGDLNLGDTTGMATPPLVTARVKAIRAQFPALSVGLHFHNTRGLGLVNVMAGLDQGVVRFDSAIGGLGGCPFAAGATGNICSEDVVHLLDELGIRTGIDLDRLIETARMVETIVGRPLPGQVMKAGKRLRLHDARRTPDAGAAASPA